MDVDQEINNLSDYFLDDPFNLPVPTTQALNNGGLYDGFDRNSGDTW